MASPPGKWKAYSARAVDEAVQLLVSEGRFTPAAPSGAAGLQWTAGPRGRAGRKVQFDLRGVVRTERGERAVKLRHHVPAGRAPTSIGKVGADGSGADEAQGLLEDALRRVGEGAQAEPAAEVAAGRGGVLSATARLEGCRTEGEGGASRRLELVPWNPEQHTAGRRPQQQAGEGDGAPAAEPRAERSRGGGETAHRQPPAPKGCSLM